MNNLINQIVNENDNKNEDQEENSEDQLNQEELLLLVKQLKNEKKTLIEKTKDFSNESSLNETLRLSIGNNINNANSFNNRLSSIHSNVKEDELKEAKLLASIHLQALENLKLKSDNPSDILKHQQNVERYLMGNSLLEFISDKDLDGKDLEINKSIYFPVLNQVKSKVYSFIISLWVN